MWWIGIFLLLQAYDPTSAQEVKVYFLRAVPRLNGTATPTDTNLTRDYYFSCNVEGRLLQWEYNHTPLSGFRIDDRGKVLVDERSDYTYTATLLSSQPMEDNQAKMDSVLVMSFPSGTDPGLFTISCSSNHNINSTTAGTVSHVEKHSENGEVQMDYVASDSIVNNRNRTHILMCAVQNVPQFIEVTGPTLAFSRFDDVGQARTIFSDDRNTVEVQGVLVVRGTHQAITLILVATPFDVVNVSCYDSVNRLSLSIEESVEATTSESFPETTTYAILETTVTPSEVLVENVTEETTPVPSSEFGELVASSEFGAPVPSSEFGASHIYWIVPVSLVPPVVAVVIIVVIITVLFRLKTNTYGFNKSPVQLDTAAKADLTNIENNTRMSNASDEVLTFNAHWIKPSSKYIICNGVARTLSEGSQESGDSGVVEGDSSSEGSRDSGGSDVDTESTGTNESFKSCEENETNSDSSLQLKQEKILEEQGNGSTKQEEICLPVENELKLPETKGDITDKRDDVCLDLEEENEPLSRKPCADPFRHSREESGPLCKSSVTVSEKTTVPQTSVKMDDDRKQYISSELNQIHKHVLNLMKINGEHLQQANVVVSVKVTAHSASQLFTPIFDSKNAVAVYFDHQQDMEENNALLTTKEIIEENECGKEVEAVSDETNKANDEKGGLRVEAEANQELNHSNDDKPGNMEEGGNGEETNNGDEEDHIRDNINENVNEQEFHHSASSASLTETDTTPVDSTKVEYCYISGEGLNKDDKIPTIDASELSVEDPEASGPHCDDLEKKISMFAGIVDSAGRDMDNTTVTEEHMPSLPHDGTDATRPADDLRDASNVMVTEERMPLQYNCSDAARPPDMVLRQRPIKTFD